MCLCLGPSGCGKTLLLKKLQNLEEVDKTSTAVSTVGTNLFSVPIGNNKFITVRELGGSMAPIWSRYFQDLKKMMYVVDTSNLCQISVAGVLFLSMLTDPLLRDCKFLLVLTKMDVSYRQMRNEALLMLQMRRLQKEISQNVTIVEASAITGEGTENILVWLKKK